MRRFFFSFALLLAFSIVTFAQNANSSTTDTSTNKSRPRTAEPKAQTPKPAATVSKPTPKPTATPSGGKTAVASAPAAGTVLAAFNKIIDGLRKTNVDLVMSGYSKDPSPVFFNYNGTVTKGWEQMRQNRESSYREIKDVKLDVRDVHVQMLGRDGAVVTCLWTQSQTFKGAPDTASGRMTLVFKRVGNEWKAVHLHTSADKPDPSRVPASEQSPSASSTP